MMTWFEGQLANLRENGKRAYVLQHHPALSCFSNFSDYYSPLVAEYDDVIAAAFYGHTHEDQYYVMNGGSSEQPVPGVVGYVASTATPQGLKNPAFRIYDVDAVTGDVLDYYHYRLDLQKQGLINNNSTNAPKPVWELVYQASQAYNLTSLDAQSWYNLGLQMITDDDLFTTYYVNYPGGLSNGIFTESERQQYVCTILGGSAAGYQSCIGSWPNVPA